MCIGLFSISLDISGCATYPAVLISCAGPNNDWATTGLFWHVYTAFCVFVVSFDISFDMCIGFSWHVYRSLWRLFWHVWRCWQVRQGPTTWAISEKRPLMISARASAPNHNEFVTMSSWRFVDGMHHWVVTCWGKKRCQRQPMGPWWFPFEPPLWVTTSCEFVTNRWWRVGESWPFGARTVSATTNGPLKVHIRVSAPTHDALWVRDKLIGKHQWVVTFRGKSDVRDNGPVVLPQCCLRKSLRPDSRWIMSSWQLVDDTWVVIVWGKSLRQWFFDDLLVQRISTSASLWWEKRGVTPRRKSWRRTCVCESSFLRTNPDLVN